MCLHRPCLLVASRQGGRLLRGSRSVVLKFHCYPVAILAQDSQDMQTPQTTPKQPPGALPAHLIREAASAAREASALASAPWRKKEASVASFSATQQGSSSAKVHAMWVAIYKNQQPGNRQGDAASSSASSSALQSSSTSHELELKLQMLIAQLEA
jgi:hypothetical protein